jgi:hypothetical protein
MRKINAMEIQAVIALPGPKRYEYFIKAIADTEEVWGLYHEGWALAATDEGQQVFPVWPFREYTLLCAVSEWKDYKPEVFTLEDFMNELLPKLKRDGILLGIFYTPSNKGITLSIDQILSDLNLELDKYR